MKMRGNFSEVSLVNVLQKLQSQRVTGALRIKNETQRGEMTIWMAAGDILHVETNTRPEHMRLGRLLLRGELIDEGALALALHTSQRDETLLGVQLLQQGVVQERALSRMLHVQFKDDLHLISRWRSAVFSFESQTVPAPWRSAQAIKTRDLSTQIARLRSQWREVRELVPTRNTTFRKAIDGPVPQEAVRQHGLSNGDLRMFGLLHPSRTFDDLIALGRVSCLSLYLSLVRLHEAGAIVSAGQAQRDSQHPELAMATVTVVREESPRTMGDSAIFHVATAVLIVAAAALGLAVFLNLDSGDEAGGAGAVKVVGAERHPVGRLPRSSVQLQRIRNAVLVYQSRYGELPTRLESLVDRGLLVERDLTFPDYGNTYVYRPDGDTFILVRPKR
ncbi:MAG: hypothetical protein CMH57_01030 [Myxococcales bacterium]|nr:hypothetical protein [Myxococcales bacterium]